MKFLTQLLFWGKLRFCRKCYCAANCSCFCHFFFLHADKYILSVKISAQTSSTPKNFRHWLTHFPCQN